MATDNIHSIGVVNRFTGPTKSLSNFTAKVKIFLNSNTLKLNIQQTG